MMDEVGILPFLSLLHSISAAYSISFHWDEERHLCIPDLHKETRRCCYSCMLCRPSPLGSKHDSVAGLGSFGLSQQIIEQQLHLMECGGEELEVRKGLNACKIQQISQQNNKETQNNESKNSLDAVT